MVVGMASLLSFMLSFAAGTVLEEFASAPVDGHVHASTLIPLKDGGVLVAWFEGSREGAPDVAIRGACRIDGVWQPVRTFAKVNPDSPHWNPVLRRADDGRLELFFKVGRNCSDWRTYVQESRDEGSTWSTPRELVFGEVRGGRGPVKNKCLRLKGGRWLAPASREIGVWRAFADISDDDGRTWRAGAEMPVPECRGNPKFGVIQPALWEDAAGGVHAFLRSNEGHVWRADSTDAGETWCEVYSTGLENLNSGLDCLKASDGKLYLALNGYTNGKNGWGHRNHLELRVSEDEGKTWALVRVLADDGVRQPDGRGTEFSYPAVIEVRPRVLGISFTWNRRRIRYVECPLSGLKTTGSSHER
ncbi:MAG: sialidase family protein [bacterium]|nr:sialidase family protein [bacterium]